MTTCGSWMLRKYILEYWVCLYVPVNSSENLESDPFLKWFKLTQTVHNLETKFASFYQFGGKIF